MTIKCGYGPWCQGLVPHTQKANSLLGQVYFVLVVFNLLVDKEASCLNTCGTVAI